MLFFFYTFTQIVVIINILKSVQASEYRQMIYNVYIYIY